MSHLRVVGCALLITAGTLWAEEKQHPPAITGNLHVDLFGLQRLADAPDLRLQDQAPLALPSRRSPWLAAGMSALVPGSGQVYTASYWEAALFVAAGMGAIWLFMAGAAGA